MLIRKLSLLILPAFLMTGAVPVDQFPEATISNESIRARIYLPNNTNGYYRGSRFDWSGVIPELLYKGHSYFGKWFDHMILSAMTRSWGRWRPFHPLATMPLRRVRTSL
jgi:hypothetical protein